MTRRFPLLLAALAATLALVLTACGDDAEPGAEQSGAEVYSNNCARCHGPDGEGGMGPTLGGGAVAEHFPDIENQITVIREGRNGMPAWGDTLSADEIRAVAEFTREELGQ